MIKIISVFGTRPEAIKIAPVILELNKIPNKVKTIILVTGQHRAMLDLPLQTFGINPDYDLNIMKENQSLGETLTNEFIGVERILKKEKPDLVLVQGDTTTTLAASLTAYYTRIKLAHIEAGLRSFDKDNPYPEEVNRSLVDLMADFCFAPSIGSKKNLLRMGIEEKRIFVTGNTGIDALHFVLGKKFEIKNEILKKISLNEKIILLTTHRRESYLSEQMKNIFEAISKISKEFPNIRIIYPVHPNPNVQSLAREILGKASKVTLLDNLSYEDFVYLFKNCYFVMTDSGGIQEEAPSLNKPVLVIRNKTERPEIIEIGAAKLVGTNINNIFKAAATLLNNSSEYKKMINKKNPYGDGTAAKKIVRYLLDYL